MWQRKLKFPMTATIIIFSCKILWACCNWRIFQKLLLLLIVIHKCVTDITLLKLVTGTDKIISALDVGELSANCSYCLSDAMRNNCLINFEHSRIVVASVTAEQFVCTLTLSQVKNSGTLFRLFSTIWISRLQIRHVSHFTLYPVLQAIM